MLLVESIDISQFTDQIRTGENVWAVQLMNSTAGDPDLFFDATISAKVGRLEELPKLQFSEVAAGVGEPFWIEIRNDDTRTHSLAGLTLGTSRLESRGQRHELPAIRLGPGQRHLVTADTLRINVGEGDVLGLFGPSDVALFDSVRVTDRGIAPKGRRWRALGLPGYTNSRNGEFV